VATKLQLNISYYIIYSKAFVLVVWSGPFELYAAASFFCIAAVVSGRDVF